MGPQRMWDRCPSNLSSQSDGRLEGWGGGRDDEVRRDVQT